MSSTLHYFLKAKTTLNMYKLFLTRIPNIDGNGFNFENIFGIKARI